MARQTVRVVFSKWGNRPHWRFSMQRLGEDAHGVWLGAGAGLEISRPGQLVSLDYPSVMVVQPGRPYTAIFNASPGLSGNSPCAVYVDITTPPQWRGDEVAMVDLDLDVVQSWDGHVFVDDEDEFAEHQQRYGYPPEIVALATDACATALAAVANADEPFGLVGRAWLDQVNSLLR